ncbi:tetratricopeptide repeat protein [candidate division WOR-3 bacterium]|nr:tetratricopeptide repeat protein [candidate division WOR-3 bacterium]
MFKIERLIYVEHDYNTALQICKEVMAMEGIDRYYKQRTESISNLIENYSDFDRKPLELYFKAREIQNMWLRGENHTKESWIDQGNLYRELLEKYHKCKLAGLTQYLLAIHCKKQIGNNLGYLNRENARDKAIEAYRNVVNKYPLAVFPIHGFPEYFEMGLRIAPIAQINMAWLYELEYHLKPDIKSALKEYQIIIDKYPEAVDNRGRRLILSSHVSIMNIYSGIRGREQFLDIPKVKEICNILLNNFQNQQYEIQGWSFGEIHPEAYMRLAELEKNKENAFKLYKKIITDYPNSWTGKSGSGATVLYSVKALDKIVHLLDDTLLAIKECLEIVNSGFDKSICGYAQYKIAKIYEKELIDYKQALVEYKKVIENFGDVNLSGEAWTLGEGAESAIRSIQNKLKKE